MFEKPRCKCPRCAASRRMRYLATSGVCLIFGLGYFAATDRQQAAPNISSEGITKPAEKPTSGRRLIASQDVGPESTQTAGADAQEPPFETGISDARREFPVAPASSPVATESGDLNALELAVTSVDESLAMAYSSDPFGLLPAWLTGNSSEMPRSSRLALADENASVAHERENAILEPGPSAQELSKESVSEPMSDTSGIAEPGRERDPEPLLTQDAAPVAAPESGDITHPTGTPVPTPAISPPPPPNAPSVAGNSVPAWKSSPSDIATVSPPDVATVSPPAVATLSPSDVATMSPPDIATVSPSDVATVNPSDVRTVSPSDVRTVSPSDVRTVSPSDVRTVSPPDVATVSPPDVRTVSPSHIATVSSPEVATVSLPEVPTVRAPEPPVQHPNTAEPVARSTPKSEPAAQNNATFQIAANARNASKESQTKSPGTWNNFVATQGDDLLRSAPRQDGRLPRGYITVESKPESLGEAPTRNRPSKPPEHQQPRTQDYPVESRENSPKPQDTWSKGGDYPAKPGDESGDLQHFASDFVRVDQSGSVGDERRFYADSVHFYGEGDLSWAGVAAATRRHHDEKQNRRYGVAARAAVKGPIDGGFYVVDQPVSWSRTDGSRVMRGRSILRLRVLPTGRAGWKITSIEEVGQ